MNEPSRVYWTEEEDQLLIELKRKGASYKEIANVVGRSWKSVRGRWLRIEDNVYSPIKESVYPRYDNPLVMEEDAAVVLPDIELPFHDADFFNRVLELAQSWGITKAIVAGDLLHFDSITAWQANWVEEGNGGLTDRDEKRLFEFAKQLPSQYQGELMDIVVDIGVKEEDGDPNISQELKVARKSVRVLSEIFDQIDFLLGNHDGRFLRALSSPMFPSELLRLVEAGEKWRIAPYYYSILISTGEKFQIEHPKTYANNSPIRLASKYCCHILQAHSHKWAKNTDISGKYWAIHMGCIVDEMRLPYAAQRHGTADAHQLGAVIVRDGFPYLLSARTPWDKYKKMK